MTQERRIIETRTAVRNTPVKRREWEALLDLDDTEAVEVDGGEMALVVRDGQLHLMFAFDTNELMKAAFNPMWAALKPRLNRFKAYPYTRFDLVAFPVREWIDHMLDEADFLPVGVWIEMEHRAAAEVEPPEAPEGLRIRRATEADRARIGAIEAEAYGEYSDGEVVTTARLAAAPWCGVIEEDGDVVAYAINSAVDGASGRTLSLGVAEEARGRGLGQVMLQAATYQLASAGARRVSVIARPDIPRSVETARAVGYRPGTSGAEFRRSMNEKANQERRRDRHVNGMKVRFGEWR